MKHRSAFLLSLLLIGQPAAANDLDYSLTPIGFVSLPPSKSLRTAYREWIHRERVFTAYFREPTEPDGGVPIDCDSTLTIGVALMLRRFGEQTLPRKKTHIRHVWTHSDPAIDSKRLDHRHIKSLPRTYSAMWDVELIDIDKKYKADGVWTLKSYIDDELKYEASFNLIGCDSDVSIEIPDPSEIAAARKAADRDDEEPVEIVCREEKATGSRIKTTVCREQPVIERRREHDQDMIRDVQSTPRIERPQ